MKEVSLKESIRKTERDAMESKQLALENQRRTAKGEKTINSIKDLDKDKNDAENKNKTKDDKTEAMLTETGYILVDYLQMNQHKLAKH